MSAIVLIQHVSQKEKKKDNFKMGIASWFDSTAYPRVSIAVVWSLLIISNLKARDVSHWPPSASWYSSGVLKFFFCQSKASTSLLNQKQQSP